MRTTIPPADWSNYGLDRVERGSGSTIAQHAYFCTGTPDFHDPTTPLETAAIASPRVAHRVDSRYSRV